MTEFITVATFNFAHEITVLKSVLENRGIPYFFENETIVSVDPLATIAYGGIKLKVHPDFIQTAKEILDNLNNPLRVV